LQPIGSLLKKSLRKVQVTHPFWYTVRGATPALTPNPLTHY
jgi:hypothetical protein